MAAMHAPQYLADHFLIAMPSLADPHFVRGVTLICQHDENGAMGLVINHLSNSRSPKYADGYRVWFRATRTAGGVARWPGAESVSP
jgi:hypothetical protein